MAIAGTLTYDTKLETDGLQKNLDKISSSTVAMGNLMADAFKKVASAMGDVVKQGITYNAQIEQYQVALTTLTGSAEEANIIMENIKKDAAKTPFDVAGLTQANQLLISAGVGADDAREDVIALGNAISATGGGNEELARMAVNLQQIKNVGKASALDIRQFAYAGIDLYGLLADYMGITKEEATELEITYEDLTGALKYASKQGGKYYGAMEEQSKTLNGQMSTLKDNFMTFAGEAAEPLFNFLKDTALPVLNDLLTGGEKVGAWIQENQQPLTLLAILVGTLTTAIIAYNIALNAATIATKIATTASTAFAAVMGFVTSPITLIIVAIGALIAIGYLLVENWELIKEKAIEIFEKVKTFIVDTFNKIVDFFKNNWKEILTFIINPFAGIFAFLYKLNPKFKEWVDGVITSIKNAFSKVTEVGKNIVEGIWTGIKNAKDWLLNKIKSFAKTITQGIKDFFGIKSPSRVMRDQVGQWLPKGIAVGIDANTDSALSSIDKMNEEIMSRMSQAVNMETAKASFSGTSGSVSQILSANSVIQVENYNTLELDGEVVYANQQQVQQRKDLQYSFGGGTSK